MTKEQALEVLKTPEGRTPAELREAMAALLASTLGLPS